MQQADTPAPDGIEPRFPASGVPAITGIRLSPGQGADLVNISRSGVLVEGHTRFVPGSRVTVIFEGPSAPEKVPGRVVRCMVSSISSGTLRYQSGIQFERKLETQPNELGQATEVAILPEPAPSNVLPLTTPAQLRNRW